MTKPVNFSRAPALFNISELELTANWTDIFLTPNHRLARHIKFAWEEILISTGRKNWPKIESHHWEIWVKNQWETAILGGLVEPMSLLNPNIEREIWRRVIFEDDTKNSSFNLVDPSTTIENAIWTRKLIQRSRLNIKDSGIESYFLLEEDCATYLRWESVFREHLFKNNIVTIEDSIARLSELRVNLERQCSINLVEFDSIPPILLDYLQEYGEVAIIDKKQKPPDSSHHVTSYVSKRTELQAVAKWVFKTFKEDTEATIGVILDDTELERQRLEHLLRREFDCLDESYNDLPINFSTLITLNQAPLIRDAFRILELVFGELRFADFVSLLQSRFINIYEDHPGLQTKILKILNRDDSKQIVLSEILSGLTRLVKKDKNLDEKFLAELKLLNQMQLTNRSDIPSNWCSCIWQCLDLFGWPGNELPDAFEIRQYELWQNLIGELMFYDSVLGKITCKETIDVLFRSTTNRPFQAETEGRRIHILGRLEAAGLSFDQLWITSIDGDHWSSAIKRSPFIPNSIQKDLDLKGQGVSVGVNSRDLISDYIRLNKSIYSSFIEDQKNQNLRFIKLFNVSETYQNRDKWTAPIAWDTAAAKLTTAFQIDQLPRILNSELKNIKGGSGLIEDQSICPIRAFLRHRCNLKHYDSFSADLSSFDRGKLMHAGLFNFWGYIQSHAELIDLDDKQIKALIKAALDEGFQQFLKSSDMIRSKIFISWELQRLNDLLWEWISFEKTRAPFKVISREANFEIECLDTVLKVSVDRIDLLEDESYLIIDYKSSLQKLSEWFGNYPRKPQLPLYAAFLPDSDGIAFAEVKKDHCGINGLIKQDDNGLKNIDPNKHRIISKEVNWDTQVKIWKQTILNLLRDFIDGQKEIKLSRVSCNNCNFSSICRIHSPGG